MNKKSLEYCMRFISSKPRVTCVQEKKEILLKRQNYLDFSVKHVIYNIIESLKKRDPGYKILIAYTMATEGTLCTLHMPKAGATQRQHNNRKIIIMATYHGSKILCYNEAPVCI